MKLFIKNMVCHRCKLTVRNILERNNLYVLNVNLGEVEITEDTIDHVLNNVSIELEEVGFELIDDKKSRIIEKIKSIIIELVHYSNDGRPSENYSDYIAQKVNKDYNYLSTLFSEVEGITIEKYIINQKIERVKELLVYDELTLSEIAFKMGYSSVAHLSSQFKKVTGLTPGFFRKLGSSKRQTLDSI